MSIGTCNKNSCFSQNATAPPIRAVQPILKSDELVEAFQIRASGNVEAGTDLAKQSDKSQTRGPALTPLDFACCLLLGIVSVCLFYSLQDQTQEIKMRLVLVSVFVFEMGRR